MPVPALQKISSANNPFPKPAFQLPSGLNNRRALCLTPEFLWFCLINGCTHLSDKNQELSSTETTYVFDVQFSSDEKDVVSVEIDSTGKGLKGFDDEVISDFDGKIGTGTFLEVSQFCVENGDEVSLKFVAQKRIFSNWQTLDDGRKNPLLKGAKLDTKLNLKCNSWTSLGSIPGREPMRVRVRRIK